MTTSRKSKVQHSSSQFGLFDPSGSVRTSDSINSEIIQQKQKLKQELKESLFLKISEERFETYFIKNIEADVAANLPQSQIGVKQVQNFPLMNRKVTLIPPMDDAKGWEESKVMISSKGYERLSNKQQKDHLRRYGFEYNPASERVIFPNIKTACRFFFEQKERQLQHKLLAECAQMAHSAISNLALGGAQTQPTFNIAVQDQMLQSLGKELKKSRHPFMQEFRQGKVSQEFSQFSKKLAEKTIEDFERKLNNKPSQNLKNQPKTKSKNEESTSKLSPSPTPLGGKPVTGNDLKTAAGSENPSPRRSTESVSDKQDHTNDAFHTGLTGNKSQTQYSGSGGDGNQGTFTDSRAKEPITGIGNTSNGISGEHRGGTGNRSDAQPQGEHISHKKKENTPSASNTETLPKEGVDASYFVLPSNDPFIKHLITSPGKMNKLGFLDRVHDGEGLYRIVKEAGSVALSLPPEESKLRNNEHLNTLLIGDVGYSPWKTNKAAWRDKETGEKLMVSYTATASPQSLGEIVDFFDQLGWKFKLRKTFYLEAYQEFTETQAKKQQQEQKSNSSLATPLDVAQQKRSPKPQKTYTSPNNFNISDGIDILPEGGDVAKLNANMKAFLLLEKLEKEGREANEEEKKVLVQYSSWGGIGNKYLKKLDNNYYNREQTFAEEILPKIIAGEAYTIEAGTYNTYDYLVQHMSDFDREAQKKGEYKTLGYHYLPEAKLNFQKYEGDPADFKALTEHVKVQIEKQAEKARLQLYSYLASPKYAPNSVHLGKLRPVSSDLIRRALIKQLLSKETYNQARKAVVNGHYTAREVISPVWKVIEEHLGFEGGKAGELSAGVGHFMGLMPKSLMGQSSWVALEPDPIAAKVASYLYPDAEVREQGIEHYYPEKGNLLDLAITNVPFGSATLTPYDKFEPKLSKFSLHNYCLAKNIKNLKEGGLLVAVSSSSTMDNSASREFRKWVNGEGDSDFMGAIRLPQNAFEKNAGTQVTTDILVFRKRVGGKKHPKAQEFLDTSVLREGIRLPESGDDKKKKYPETIGVEVNEYFAKNPDNIIGQMYLAHETAHALYRLNEQTCAWYSKEDFTGRIEKCKSEIESDKKALKALTEAGKLDLEEQGVIEGRIKQYSTYLALYTILAEQAPLASEQNISKSIENIAKKSLPKGIFKEIERKLELSPSTATKERSINPNVQIEQITANWRYNSVSGELLLKSQNQEGYIEYYPIDTPEEVNTLKKHKGKVVKHSPKSLIQAYDAIRETFLELNQLETKVSVDDPVQNEALVKLRETLNLHYDTFTSNYGPLGQPGKRLSFLKNDPQFPMVAALEKRVTIPRPGKRPEFRFEKADIMQARQVFPVIEPQSAQSIEDAAKISLMYRGEEIDMAYLSELMGEEDKEVLEKALLQKGVAFKNPSTGKMETPESYLSGSVREKLKVAKEHAREDAIFQANVEALEAALPETIPFEDIYCNLGANYIPPKVIKAFAQDKLNLDTRVFYHKSSNKWHVDVLSGDASISEFNTNRMQGIDLLRASLNLRSVDVKDKTQVDGKEKWVKNFPETAAANERKVALEQAFKTWLMDQKKFHAEIVERYNFAHNGIVNKSWNTPALTHFPGANNAITLRKHQKRAVGRNLLECAMNAHEPGTGKTFTMITTAMEARRLNPREKVVIVVQNQTLEQFVESFKVLYPSANILAPSKSDYTKENRQRILSQIATNDYDAIIIPQSQIDMIPDNPERIRAYIQEEINEALEELGEIDDELSKEARQLKTYIKQLEDTSNKLLKGQLDEISEGSDKNTKDEVRLEAAIEKKLRSQFNRKTDDILTFEQLGVTRLFVDEAHAYKRLGFATQLTNVKGIDVAGSKRAMSMFLKTRHIQEKNNGKGVGFFTGTPISNTAAEVWTWIKYLKPELLDQRGISKFDAFAQVYGNIKEHFEQTPSGDFKEVQRFAGYDNVPELNAMWREVADVVLTEDVSEFQEQKEFVAGKSVPKMKNNSFTTEFIPNSPYQKNIRDVFIEVLDAFEAMEPKEKREKSYYPLVIYGQAVRATIDLRLLKGATNYAVGAEYDERVVDVDDPLSKANQSVKEISRVYKETKDKKGSQLVFCDRYRSTDKSFNLFYEIRDKLIAEGIPAEEIVVITDKEYEKDYNREALFSKVQKGEVRVVLGSTEKMGVGVNVQHKLVALHHLDAPIRPSDFEQRNRRILRQGNENEEVELFTYGIKGSMDMVMYQSLETKANFIRQIMKADSTQRSMKDEGSDGDQDSEDLFASMKANLSDNPLLIMHLKTKKELGRAESALKILKERYKKNKQTIGEKKEYFEQMQKSLVNYRDFQQRVNVLTKALEPGQDLGEIQSIEIASYRGHPLRIEVEKEHFSAQEDQQKELWRCSKGQFNKRMEILVTDKEGKEVTSLAARKKLGEKEKGVLITIKDRDTDKVILRLNNDYETSASELKQKAYEAMLVSTMKEGHPIDPEIIKNANFEDKVRKELSALNKVAFAEGKQPLRVNRKEAEKFLSEYLKGRETKLQGELTKVLTSAEVQKTKKLPPKVFIQDADLKINGMDYKLRMGYSSSFSLEHSNNIYEAKVPGVGDIKLDKQFKIVPVGLERLPQQISLSGSSLLGKFSSQLYSAESNLQRKEAIMENLDQSIQKIEEMLADKKPLEKAQDKLDDLEAQLEALETEMKNGESKTGGRNTSNEETEDQRSEKEKMLDFTLGNSHSLEKIEQLMLHYFIQECKAQGKSELCFENEGASIQFSVDKTLMNDKECPIYALEFSSSGIGEPVFKVDFFSKGETEPQAAIYPYQAKQENLEVPGNWFSSRFYLGEDHPENPEKLLLNNDDIARLQRNFVRNDLPKKLNPKSFLKAFPELKKGFDKFMVREIYREDKVREENEVRNKLEREAKLKKIKAALKAKKLKAKESLKKVVGILAKPQAKSEGQATTGTGTPQAKRSEHSPFPTPVKNPALRKSNLGITKTKKSKTPGF